MALGLSLGADVPMCLAGAPLIASGIGDVLRPIDALPTLALVLVNPLVGVSTPAVFAALRQKTNRPLPDLPGGEATDKDWIDAIGALRNDLEAPAAGLQPLISAVRDALLAENAALVRMSGSGATCFGLFETTDQAAMAAERLRQRHPGWYVEATSTLSRTDR